MFFRIFAIVSLLFSAAAFADPCPQDSSANAPLSTSNSGTVSTAGQAASQVAIVPVETKKNKRPHRQLFAFSLSGQGNSGTPKTGFIDLTAEEYANLDNPKAPGYNQAQADFGSAWKLYQSVTALPSCAANDTVCAKKVFTSYQSLLNSNQSMSIAARQYYGSILLGNNLGNLYRANSGITPLPTVLQALITNSINAGECRDIMTFISTSMTSLGFKCGVVGTDWNNGSVTGAHVVSQCKDPSTGHNVFTNYGEEFDSLDSNTLRSAEKAALALNNYTTVTQIGSVDQNGNGKMYEVQGPRTQQIQGNIAKAADPDAPIIQASLGNNQGMVGANYQFIARNSPSLFNAGEHDYLDVGAFGMGSYQRDGDAYQAGSGGVSIFGGTRFLSTDHTTFSLTGDTKDGILYVRDQDPVGDSNTDSGTRSSTLFFTNTSAALHYGWNESGQGGNSGHVGVDANVQDATYTQGYFSAGNLPFDTINLVAVDNPTKSVQLHFTNTGFIANTTEQNIKPSYHNIDQAAGVKFTKEGYRYVASTDVTAYSFGQGAVGVTNSTSFKLKSPRWGDLIVEARTGYLRSGSAGSLFDYPLTCKISANWEKQTSHVTIDAGGEYNCNQTNAFYFFHLDDPTNIVPAKEQYGVTFHFK